MSNVDFRVLQGVELRAELGTLKGFFDYFEGFNQDGGLVSRAIMDPAALRNWISRMVLLDLILDANEQVVDILGRVLGEDIISFYGNFTGRSLTENNSNKATERVFAAANQMVASRAPILTLAQGSVAGLRGFLVKSLYIPLLGDDPDVPAFLVGAVELVAISD